MIIDSPDREVLFVSHAYPENNEFALWIALKLATAGYPVWCDLTHLLGGEDFWKDVEKIIRHKAVKVLYVLSRVSNEKEGTLQEVAVAKEVAKKHGLKDFIIPLLVDDLPRSEINIELKRINSISFYESWAVGLQTLIEKLEQAGVSKKANYSIESVSQWWKINYSANKGVKEEPQNCYSNWFEIDGYPNKLYYHVLKPGYKARFQPNESGFIYPYREHARGILTFAEAPTDFPDGDELFGDRFTFYVDNLFQNRHKKDFIDDRLARDVITDLLRQAWENLFIQRGLATYELANKSKSCYFKLNQLPDDKIHFVGINNKKTWRSIIGYKTVGAKKRFWHFGISARPYLRSTKYFAVSPHVLFSEEGTDIWKDKGRLHKAKMSQCKNWWNAQWRDRILAVMDFLAGDKNEISLALSSDDKLNVIVDKHPILFTSPVSFPDPEINTKSDDPNSEDDLPEEFIGDNDSEEDEDMEENY
ncbi:MAG TPA: toll/interleukin-1 receptor domain-containing protein [Pyrinomonadaceae bacterium]|jgi:hypothetical protein